MSNSEERVFLPTLSQRIESVGLTFERGASSFGPIWIDNEQPIKNVHENGKFLRFRNSETKVYLSGREVEVMSALMGLARESPGAIISSTDIYEWLKEEKPDSDTKSDELHKRRNSPEHHLIQSLREKLALLVNGIVNDFNFSTMLGHIKCKENRNTVPLQNQSWIKNLINQALKQIYIKGLKKLFQDQIIRILLQEHKI